MSQQTQPNDSTNKPADTQGADSNAQGARDKLLADSQKPVPPEAPKNTADKSGASDDKSNPATDKTNPATDKSNSATDKTNPETDKSTTSSEKQNEWTVVVDLTATKYRADISGPNAKPEIQTMGAVAKYKKLQELAAESANKPVTFVVQLASHGEPHLLQNGRIVEGDNNPNEPAKLERYRIKDGKIEQLAAPKDEGFAKNLANLTKSAIEENPSKKVALIMNADGGGNVGFQGADGRAGLDDVTDALKAALKGTAHEKLDLIDYDCCMMAQEGALKKTGEIANTAVAPAEEERTNSRFDGQNTMVELQGLLKNPEMSGADFAKQIVEEAKGGSNDAANAAKGDKTSIYDSATNDLGAFDLTKGNDLSASLDKFGTALEQACSQSPETKKGIQAIIHNMGSYGANGTPDSDCYQVRDLKLFAQNVLGGIKSGTIKDDAQNDLANAANEVIQNQEKMTIDQFGRAASNARVPYDKAGDLSVFLPDVGFYDSTQAIKDRLNSMAGLVNHVMKDPETKSNPEDWDASAAGVVMDGLGSYRGMFKNGGAQSKDSEDLLKELSAYRQLSTHEERVRALGDIQTTISNLQKQPELDGALRKEANRIAAKHSQYWQLEAAGDETGWNKFVDILRQPSS